MENFPDMGVLVGTRGRLDAAVPRPGQLMLCTMAANGAVFPIAGGMTTGREVVPLGPERTVVLPSDQGFELVMCPPVGEALWFTLHASGPIPDGARGRLARELSGARVAEAKRVVCFRAVLDRVLVEALGWTARGHTLIYEVLPAQADPARAPSRAAASRVSGGARRRAGLPVAARHRARSRRGSAPRLTGRRMSSASMYACRSPARA